MTITKQQMIEKHIATLEHYNGFRGRNTIQYKETAKAIEAIRAHLQSAVVVRDDWQIVPKIMTNDMYDAISDSKYVWAEMLAAAPDYREE